MKFRTVHSSWCIAWLSVGVVFGVALCWFLPADLAGLFLLIGGVCGVVGFWQRSSFALIFIVISGMLVGMCRGSAEQVALARYQGYIGQKLQITGKVTEDVEKGRSGELRLKVSDIVLDSTRLSGEIWASASTNLTVKRSDIVTLEGKLRKGFGTYAASLSYAKVVKVTRVEGADIARDMRDNFTDAIRRGTSEPGASLAAGFLTGQKSALPPDLDEQLRVVGLTHVVVASGSNLTILVRAARRFFASLSKFVATSLAGGLVAGFVVMTGLSPSMSRAGFVAGLSLFVWYYGRSIHPFVLLSFAAAVTTMANPSFLWGDLGWYLSFGAFVGVIILSPLVHHAVWGEKRAGFARQLLVDTLCAQIVTMPMIAFSFGTFAPYALLANAFVVPFIPLAMLMTFVVGIFGLATPWIAQFVGWPLEMLMSYILWIVDLLANLPGAEAEITFDLPLLVVSYLGIVGVMIIMWRRTKHNFWGDNLVE